MSLLKRRIYSEGKYSFTKDYISSYAPILKHYLHDYVGSENLNLLEIGSYEGRSSIWFLENVLTHPSAKLYCVDPFLDFRSEFMFDHNIGVSSFSDRVTKIKDRSENVLVSLERDSFDIVYIDGSHQALNVLMDAVMSWLLTNKGGIIIFDDYKWKPEKPLIERPSLAIDVFLDAFSSHIDVLHKDYQVIVRKRH